jgi:hypothetical protein
MPNCVLWLDAADTSSYTTVSTYVNTWRTKVRYDSSVVALSDSNTASFNVNPTIKQVNSLITFMFVCTNNGTSSLQCLLPTISYKQNRRTIFYLINADDGYYNDGTAYQAYSTSFGSFNFKITDILQFTGNNTTMYSDPVDITYKTSIICITTNTGFFVDGSYITSYNQITSMPTPPSSTGQYIGNAIPSGLYVDGLAIGEFLIFDGALTDTERQQVEGYLANKWGIQSQLPATHPYYYAITIQNPTQIPGCLLWLDGADASTITIGKMTGGQYPPSPDTATYIHVGQINQVMVIMQTVH